MTDIIKNTCIHCSRTDGQVPLVAVTFQGGEFQICTEHFPILIHRPQELTGKLPGADRLTPAEHDHD